ncbi:TonB-dependent receptor, partial [mine drainage metagenome]
MGITLDYYRILVKNTIGEVPPLDIYQNPTQFAGLIHTNASGTLTPSAAESAYCTPYTQATCGYILANLANVGRMSTDGVDVSITYAQQTRFGEFREDLEGTAITQFQVQNYPGGPQINLVGWYNQGNEPAPRWQHIVRVDWTSPEASGVTGLSNRFYSSYIDENTIAS